MLSSIAQSFLDLVFPQTCLNCKQLLPQNLHLLCPVCLEQMPFTEPEDHCKHCYAFLNGELCNRCIRSPSPFFQCLAPFSGSLSAMALARGLLHPTGKFLATSLASLIIVHMDRHNFAPGQWLIPAADAGSIRLTSALSQFLKIPFYQAINPPSLLLPCPSLKKKSVPLLEEQNITFVSLGTKGFTNELQEAGVLTEAFPRSLNALIFSRQI